MKEKLKRILNWVKDPQNRSYLILIAAFGALFTIVVSIIPKAVWGVILVISFIVWEIISNNPRNEGNPDNYSMIAMAKVAYWEIADGLFPAIKNVATGFAINMPTVQSLALPEQKRVTVKGNDYFYNYSCPISGDNDRATLRQFRDYINRELKATHNANDPLIVVTELHQTNNRLFITATTVNSVIEESRLYGSMERR